MSSVCSNNTITFYFSYKENCGQISEYSLSPRKKAPFKFTTKVKMPLAKCPRGNHLPQRNSPTEESFPSKNGISIEGSIR